MISIKIISIQGHNSLSKIPRGRWVSEFRINIIQILYVIPSMGSRAAPHYQISTIQYNIRLFMRIRKRTLIASHQFGSGFATK